MSLYDIKQEILNCVRIPDEEDLMVNTETGEVFDTEAFDKLQMDFEEKCLELGRWVKNLDAEREAIYKERKKLEGREKAISRKMDSIRNYLSFLLDGKTVYDANTVLKFSKSTKTEVDLNELMRFDDCDSYLTYAEPKPNLAEIKSAIKSGKTIPGCKLVENLNLQIK